MLIKILCGLIAFEHIGFLLLEMFFWNTPTGHKIFRLEPSFAEQSSALAMNQGLYNGFLSVGLFWALFFWQGKEQIHLLLFFVGCVFIAGVFGWATVSRTILFVQAIPAAITLLLLLRVNSL